MIEKVLPTMNTEKLENDLERYKEKVLELGASRAAIIPVSDIPVEDRIVLKCQVPRCFGYGVCANCPPHALKPAELREHLKSYSQAVFFTKDVLPEVIIRNKTTIKERVAVYKEIFQMVSKIESMAFYDGHYLSFGFGAGSCRHTFCGLEESCLALEGKKCRFSLLSRPSMEAVGINVFKMVAQLDWDIYPIGSSAKADIVPKGTLAGIVIVE